MTTDQLKKANEIIDNIKTCNQFLIYLGSENCSLSMVPPSGQNGEVIKIVKGGEKFNSLFEAVEFEVEQIKKSYEKEFENL